jgi:hypothetical protein
MPSKPVNNDILVVVGPLIDSTDFRTREESIAWNAAGMEIDAIHEHTDGTITTDAIALTSGGLHDWTHLDQGYYQIAIPAIGGDHANDSLGNLHLVGHCTGVLPFRSALYDVVATPLAPSAPGVPVGLDLSLDHLNFDGLENVTLSSYGPAVIENAYRLRRDMVEGDPTHATYLHTDVEFQLPTVDVPAIAPAVGDEIVAWDATFVIQSIRQPFMSDYWGCGCREAAITADATLHDLVTLWPVSVAVDEYGSRVATHPAADPLFSEVPAKIQIRPGLIGTHAGRVQFLRLYDIYVARDIDVQIGDLLIDQSLNQYDVQSWENRDRIDELSHIVGRVTD